MKPGIYTDLSIEDYHQKVKAISASALKKIKKSELDYWHHYNNTEEQERKSHFDYGNAFELAIMDAANGTNEFDQKVAVMPTNDWTAKAMADNPNLKSPAASKIYKEAKAEWEAINAEKYHIALTGKESMETITHTLNQLRKDETVWKLIEGTSYQVSAIWKDEETGLMLKTRPDVAKINKNVVLDIKTCQDASPFGFARQATNLDYPIQAVMQIDGMIQSGCMDKVDRYYWLAVEKEAPYNYGLYYFLPEDIEAVMAKYRALLKKAAKIDFENPKSYGGAADNQYGILNLEIPKYYL